MPKLTLTDDERIRLSEYIGFLLRNPNPCTTCFEGSGCCGCKEQSEWCEAKKKYNVDSLLKYEEVSKYVDANIDLKAVNDRIEGLLRQQKELESNIREHMADFDPAFCKGEKVEDSVKNLEVCFTCLSCHTRFRVPVNDVYVYMRKKDNSEGYRHPCPKCHTQCFQSK